MAAAWLAALILISWVPTGLAQGQDADASADDDKPYNAATSNLEVGKFTADELLNMGMTAYRAQRWEEALNSFGAFLRDYGSAREAAGAITRVRPLIAMCLVQLKRWGEALQAIEEVFPLEKEIDPGTLEQIYFWKGACLFFLEEFGPAREALNIFAEKFPQSQKFTEALLLTATSYVLEGDFEGSVDFCRKAKNILRGPDRSQIVVLELYSLLEIPKTDEAYELVKEEFERLDDMVQLAAFQSMTLKLGSQFLVEKKYHAAIGCLQRLWPLEQILGRQEERLNILKQRLANAEARKDDPFNIHKLNQLIGKIERELKSFKKIEHWDSATRMRVATAYIQLERYREAALVLDDMLRDLPADPIVEQASMNLIKLWMLIESWDRAVEASALFQEKFPKSPQVPMAMILRGQSLQFMGNYDEALKEFEKLVDEHPDDVLAAKGEFMIGFTLIMQDEFELAIETFEGVEKEFPNSDVLADTLYWKGMTHSMAKRHEIALGMMDQYLKKYPQGTEAGEAAFRRAYSLHGLKRYDEGIAGFLKFVKDYPQSDRIGEARLLAGDAYLAQGKIDEGAKIYRQIPPDDVSFFEEAWFKIGKAYKQQDRFADLELHMRDFVRTRTESPRVAEAVYWQGWAQKQQGHEDRAREIYWETLRKYGNNPAVSSVEDLFEGLGKLYGSQNQLPDLIAELTRMTDAAKAEKQDIMALRLLWGRAMLLEKREPENARNLLIQAASFTKFDSSSSRILVDIADAYLAAGDIPKATEFYRETLRWNPRSLQKDRIFMGLGELAEKDGRKEEALKYYQRFAEETIMSIRLGEILARKADIEIELGKKEEARGTLDQILATKSIKGKRKAETLLKMGDVMRSQGKLQAASQYYERVYLLYGKWGDLVARAYLNRGEVLESLDNKLEAAKTYRELEKREDLAQLEPAIAARRKLEPLRALLPKEEAVPAAAAAPQATEVAQP